MICWIFKGKKVSTPDIPFRKIYNFPTTTSNQMYFHPKEIAENVLANPYLSQYLRLLVGRLPKVGMKT